MAAAVGLAWKFRRVYNGLIFIDCKIASGVPIRDYAKEPPLGMERHIWDKGERLKWLPVIGATKSQ